MFKKLTAMWQGRNTDATWMGWHWRFLTGVGAGILFAARVLDDEEDLRIGLEMGMTILGVGLILMGELKLLSYLDEFFRRVEERAMAAGGLVAITGTVLTVYIGRLWLDPISIMQIGMGVLLVVYFAVRTLYATYVHEQNKDMEDD